MITSLGLGCDVKFRVRWQIASWRGVGGWPHAISMGWRYGIIPAARNFTPHPRYARIGRFDKPTTYNFRDHRAGNCASGSGWAGIGDTKPAGSLCLRSVLNTRTAAECCAGAGRSAAYACRLEPAKPIYLSDCNCWLRRSKKIGCYVPHECSSAKRRGI